jgi:outer membrane lipoprotein SlyB
MDFQPRDMSSKVTPGRHVMGDNKSGFISTSEKSFGAPRFEGNRYWIDVNILKNEGVKFYNAAEIAADFSRIEAKYKDNLKVLEKVRKGLEFLKMDKEVLVEGPIPAKAVKTAPKMAFTRGTQILQGLAFVETVSDITYAGYDSYREMSIKPVEKELVKQVSIWSMSAIGSRIGQVIGGGVGFLGGALLSIETGPGVCIGAGAGLVAGGYVGSYYGEWLAGYLDEILFD